MKAYAINYPETLSIDAFTPSLEDEDGTAYPGLDSGDLVVNWTTDNPGVIDLSTIAVGGLSGDISIKGSGCGLVTATITGYPNGNTESHQFYLACGWPGPDKPTVTLSVDTP